MSFCVRTCLALAAMLATALPASGEDILFSFGGGGGNIGQGTNFAGSSLFSPNPILTSNADVPGIGGDFVNQSAQGLGVGHTLDFLNGPFDLDNQGFTETLNLTLSNLGYYSNFQLIGVLVNNWDSNDDLQVLKNGTFQQSLAGLTNSPFINLVTPISLALGDTIGLKGTGSGFQLANDDYQIAGLVIRATPVPEPVSLLAWGLVGGVGFVGSRLRRRS